MSDPLADVMRQAADDWFGMPDERGLWEREAAAVRAHLAAVLDAEEASWDRRTDWEGHGARKAVASLRTALCIKGPR